MKVGAVLVTSILLVEEIIHKKIQAKNILKSGDNILQLRGRWQDIDFGDGVMRPTMASLHPTYLMRSPAQKRLAFDDWCGLYHRLGKQVGNKTPPVSG